MTVDLNTETDWAYLAGMIDGEGHATIFRHYRKNHVSCRGYELEPILKLTSMNKPLLESIQKSFGMGSIITMRDKRRKGEDACFIFVYDLRFKVNDQRRILPKIIPYLRQKKQIAIIIQNFLDYRQLPNAQKIKEQKYADFELQLYDATVVSKPWMVEHKKL